MYLQKPKAVCTGSRLVGTNTLLHQVKKFKYCTV